MYIKRDLEKIVINASKAFPVVLVTGPRQVGKTTMLEKLSDNNRTYVTLDNPLLRELAINDPALFLQRYTPPLLIDEIQYAPELLPHIKMYVDTNKKKGDFWITGSQMFHLIKNVSESLAGRVAVINMLGLSTNEIMNESGLPYTTNISGLIEKFKSAKKLNLKQVFDRIFKGSMPALYETEQELEMFYYSYLNTYIQRDIKQLTQVANEMDFMRFMVCCGARTGQVLNMADLARDSGVSAPTAKNWLSILVSSGIVTLVEPYFNNAIKRAVKSPKLYFLDTGLCAYLTKWSSSETLEASAMSGAFFESYVVSEIIKSYYNSGRRPPIYYYRDKDKKEIDLIIEQDSVLYPIEIKKSASPKSDAVKYFSVLENTGKSVGEGNVICLADDVIPIDSKNSIVPVWLI